MAPTKAWLINAAPKGVLVRLSFKTEAGNAVLWDDYHPYFYLQVKPGEAERVADIMEKHPHVTKTDVQSKFATILNLKKEPVVRVEVESTKWFRPAIQDTLKVPGVVQACETDVPHYAKYLMDKSLQFFTPYEITKNGDFLEDFRISEGNLPTLSFAAVFPTQNGLGFCLPGQKSASTSPLGLENAIRRNRVDVLFSWQGDAFFPKLDLRGTYTTPLGCFFDSTIHIDVRKDYTRDIYADDPQYNRLPPPEYLLELGRERWLRVVELSWMTGVRPDVVSRIAPGRLNTFLHSEAAKKNDILIPDLKALSEQPKTLRELLQLDKGGTIFYPEPGIYRNVAKLDFSSMYPSIIVNYNLSPETLNCSCCPQGEAVPGAPWHLCRKRIGVIPKGIHKVLERRLELKHAMKAEKDPARKRELDLRQRALKNILVTCFGYLGFNNFVFSNVECKEAVMLYGRHILEQTKLLAEEHGLDVIYGIVDSVFTQGGDAQTVKAFAAEVQEKTGIELALDASFKAIVFPAGAQGGRVANRYYGLTTDGEIEARGICVRRSDSPPIVKKFQEKCIRLLLEEGDFYQNYQKCFDLLETEYRAIRAGAYDLADFVVVRQIRKSIDAYKVSLAHVEAYKKAPNPHGYVEFVYTIEGPTPRAMARRELIDARHYVYLMRKSLSELRNGLNPIPVE
ncbi:hypothetical protein HY628_02720 [Candidatus Uhrbacteria bacterium]|nr:hypothetical protein [Candidatus Uhrbacteria bacterium]